ncbi:MAG: NAD(P)-dependent oxidoreductase [Stygiobacter sp. RIFOXYC12_FULL_38_8]|nr:MAG: NAD(P)-dependent oxidoreductase [Stygiobacter sp. GWC2_38_9]OGU84977.1 MAG: NAD(P)-dependent oxidoreductase [Stygiobacter sp. RIFOXYA12_FULL_38_9]OGV09694.1 MAG: NAD(P)-dependent oxidoreductase [Stygiobacter sp. RIFOXYB2_FULL_37_11]OGV11162.1 MAG: NAD(P)-dependent oxidoreductase [Stygiobacter sp. RIFOXYA2_FULL_38_8]OGV13561.1 MAG: NAD(P)-dependent oxidoreductase [Stygiobacter sp. RIFOXYC2_FULL_38_25]OGV26672.1 MAG: NAD(P)-dependent oxidoreductase [Stygiobacter sp. RIFOXYC12_FULL_38_8]
MESLKGKIVFITGASSGIGKSCAYAFAAKGANLVISARREKIVEEVAKDIREKFGVKVYTIKLDVRNREEITKAVSALPDEWKGIDILINNAGLARGMDKFYDDDPNGWDEMIDTNVKGLLFVTHAILPGMIERKFGHIINIGSIAGREAYPKGAVYCATKHAVDAITRSLRMDTIDKNILVSTIDAGMVETNFSNIRFGDPEKAKNVYKGLTPLTGDDIADAVVFCASRPAHVNIAEITLLAARQASATISYRE